MNKNILFYSNNCEYSQKLISIINEEKIGHNLVRICVDGICDKLPKFVQSVPTIFLRDTKQVITDDDIQKWITVERKSLRKKDLEPYSMLSSSFSASFSSLDDSDQFPNNNFTEIGQNNMINTTAVAETPKSSVKDNYEKMMNQRKLDMGGIKRI